MSNTRIEVDYTDSVIAYIRGHKTHQDFINQELQHFNRVYGELCQYDHRTEWVTGITAVGWLMGSVTLLGGLVFSASYILASHELFGRPVYAKQYQDQLNKLYEIYCWCIKGNGKAIASDKTFLELAKQIAPFVTYEDLKKPFGDFKDIAEAFANILLQQPLHQQKFLNDKKMPTSSWSFWPLSWNKKNEDVSVATVSAQSNKSWTECYTQTIATARFAFYSRQTKQPQTMIERGQELVKPMLELRSAMK